MLNRIFQLLFVACLVTSSVWAADNPFVGKWKLNPAKSKLPDQMKVESVGANKYSFDFGGGAETIVTDGTYQPGSFGTTLSVSVEGPDRWKVVRKKDGHVLLEANWKLSKDGNTLMDNFRGINPNGLTYILDYVYKRTAGGSGFAGTWDSTNMTENTVLVLGVKVYEGDGLSLIDPSDSLTMNLKFDSKDYPNQGPYLPPGYTNSSRRVNDRTVEITDKVNGKTVSTRHMELSSDLKTLTIALISAGQSDAKYLWVFEQQ